MARDPAVIPRVYDGPASCSEVTRDDPLKPRASPGPASSRSVACPTQGMDGATGDRDADAEGGLDCGWTDDAASHSDPCPTIRGDRS
jgi:hypothetical protein